MRDGKKIAVDIYVPDTTAGMQYSTVLVQTPYNRQAYRNIGLPLVGNDVSGSPFAYVIADWRGFYGSMAANVPGYDRGLDGYDIVEWIAAKGWSNGRIGTWGPSALGRIQYLTAKQFPPHLVCCVPLVAAPQYNYDEYYPGGVYRTEYVQQLDALGFGMSAFILAHPTYDITWQYFVEPPTFYPDSIAVPLLMIGGWYDHCPVEMLEFFSAIQTDSDPAVRNLHRLLMGPWAHGGFGPAQVGTALQGQLYFYEAEGWSDSLAMDFLLYHLDSVQNGWETTPAVRYFQMGENHWYSASQWPTADVSPYNLYMHSGGALLPEIPAASGNIGIITYDPRDPSPTVGGATLRQDLGQGPYDQAPVVEARNDILTFTSIILGQDVVMKGKTKAHLWVSSDRRDTDFAVRLTDVYPDGRSMLLADGIRRLRFRNGYAPADTAAAIPGTSYEITIELPDLAHTFLAGHRIRVDVTSANYPRYDCNLNNGLSMYTAGDTLTATNLIQLNSAHASFVELPLVDFVGSAGEKASAENDIVISPNPATDILNIVFKSNTDKKEKLFILDMAGRVISQHEANGPDAMQINIKELECGIYFIRHAGRTQKWVKM